MVQRCTQPYFCATEQAVPGLMPLGRRQHTEQRQHDAADPNVGLKPAYPHGAALAPSPAPSCHLQLWL